MLSQNGLSNMVLFIYSYDCAVNDNDSKIAWQFSKGESVVIDPEKLHLIKCSSKSSSQTEMLF